MHPILIKIGPLPIHSYGLMLALSFLFGMMVAAKRAEKMGVDKNAIMDLAFWIIVSAIVGSRLYYVILHPEEFSDNWLNAVNPFSSGQFGIGGLVMFGGLIGAVAAGTLYLRIKKLPVLLTGDVASPSLGLGIFLTRIGCFLNGCCYGHCTHLGWGVSFPKGSPAGHYQHLQHCDLLHPSQLYLAVGGLAIFALAMGLERFKRSEGHTFMIVLALYAILRFVVDYTRHYTADETILSLSHNQWFCVLLFIGAVAIWTWRFVKAGRDRETQPEPAEAPTPSSSDPE